MATPRKQQFEEHPFQDNWSSCVEKVGELELPIVANTDSIQNFARLNKAIKYVDGLLNACDSDLIPISVWGGFNTESVNLLRQLNSFESSENVAHIDSANTHLDKLIQYLSPYVISGKGAAQALGRAISAQSKAVLESTEQLSAAVTEQLSKVEEDAGKVVSHFNNSKIKIEAIEELRERLLDDAEEESVSTKIDSLLERITEVEERANEFSETVFGSGDDDWDEDEGDTSISGKVNSAFEAISEQKTKADEEINSLNEVLEDLRQTHLQLFGTKNDEGEIVGGLKNEYDVLIERINNYGQRQKEIHKSITDQMNELLKGVTSAGLASSFQKQRSKYEKPIRLYNILFIVSIVALVLVSLSTFAGYNKLEGFTWGSPKGLLEMTIATFMRAPIAAPIIWLTIFASSRRAENRRLEEEYAHKETIARAYNGFKEQVEAMGGEAANTLSAQLLEAAISSAAFNASQTLDKVSKEDFSNHNNLDSILKELKKIKGINSLLRE